MTLKVSIRLPSDALITIEATTASEVQETVGPLLRELASNLTLVSPHDHELSPTPHQGKNAVPPTGCAAVEAAPSSKMEDEVISREKPEREAAFARFCLSASPIGDMRRGVVVAEGAARLLGMDGVSERELGDLFDLAGWRRPGDIVQTLRNAARSKFRWMERVPGRPGYYAVSDAGRRAVLRQT